MVMVLKKELAFFILIIVFALAISLFALSIHYIDPFDLTIRLLALNGYIALSIAAILTPFIKEVSFSSKNPSPKSTTTSPPQAWC